MKKTTTRRAAMPADILGKLLEEGAQQLEFSIPYFPADLVSDAAESFDAAPAALEAAPASPVEAAAADEAAAPEAAADEAAPVEPEAPAADEAAALEAAADEAAEEIQQARPVPEKTFRNTAITGRGWVILFDGGADRTRVILSEDRRAALAPAVEAAGFYYSRTLDSWNKKLTFKAHRAAVALAAELEKIA